MTIKNTIFDAYFDNPSVQKLHAKKQLKSEVLPSLLWGFCIFFNNSKSSSNFSFYDTDIKIFQKQ